MALARVMASRSEPGPLSAIVVTAMLPRGSISTGALSSEVPSAVVTVAESQPPGMSRISGELIEFRAIVNSATPFASVPTVVDPIHRLASAKPSGPRNGAA